MITAEDIVNKRFSRSVLGYDIGEVDLFLDAVIEQFEAYERERKEMMTAMDYLLKELEQFDDVMEGVAAVKRERGMTGGSSDEEDPFAETDADTPQTEDVTGEAITEVTEPAAEETPDGTENAEDIASSAEEEPEERTDGDKTEETPQDTETETVTDDTEPQQPRNAENE